MSDPSGLVEFPNSFSNVDEHALLTQSTVATGATLIYPPTRHEDDKQAGCVLFCALGFSGFRHQRYYGQRAAGDESNWGEREK